MQKPECSGSTEKIHDLIPYILLFLGLYAFIVAPVMSTLTHPRFATLTFLESAAWGGGALGALTVLVTVGGFYYKNCHRDYNGGWRCVSGVINGIHRSFDDTTSQIFTFAASHDRIDVVVKSEYWRLVAYERSLGIAFVSCNNDPDRSVLAYGFFHNSAVCAAGLGATIGAVVGAVIGTIVGALAGLALGAALGCAATGPAYLLCLLAVLIVACIVAAVITLACAMVGGWIGKSVAENRAPTGVEEESVEEDTLRIGDYVSLRGDLTGHPDLNHSATFWFVEETTIHGESDVSPPFSYKDPDQFLTEDRCMLKIR
jgi:hypothetical protein